MRKNVKHSVWVLFGTGWCLLTSSAFAQQSQDEWCLCLGDACPAAGPAWQNITNLESPKLPDCVLCATDAAPGACEAYWANAGVNLGDIARVATVQEAITAINICYTLQGGPVNIVVDGHGQSGVQCFGPGGECIGNNPPYDTNKAQFVTQLQGKIKNLIFLGCSTAGDPKGQGFLTKLTEELGANIVKGWTDKNRSVWSYLVANKPTACTQHAHCPTGQSCATGFCHDIVAGTVSFQTIGEKKQIPAVGSWGMVVIALLVLAAGTVVIRRAGPARMAN